MNGHTDNRKIIDLAIESVKVEGRFRKDLGDLKPLAESMARVGQLHPIVVRSDLSLIAGLRRLEAAKLNRWATIRAMVDPFFDDALQALIAERDENDPEIRKEMTVSEKVALGRAIEPLEREKAAERQKAGKGSDGSGGRGNKKPCGESPQGFSAGHKKPPRTRDKVAEAQRRRP